VLNALDLIFLSDRKRRETIISLQELSAADEWLAKRLQEHVPKNVLRDILIDYRVNTMDPDFSFYKAIHGEKPAPLRPLSFG
jgi:hypothetical protein